MKRERTIALWIGMQGSGKTYAMKARVQRAIKAGDYSTIIVADRCLEWSHDDGAGYVLVIGSRGDYLDAVSDGALPNLVIVQAGRDVADYEWILTEAVAQGHALVVLDEAWAWAPNGSSWRGPDRLLEILLAGRHLPDLEGKPQPTSLFMATQRPADVHSAIKSQATEIYLGELRGEGDLRWVRDALGDEVAARTRAIPRGSHRWIRA